MSWIYFFKICVFSLLWINCSSQEASFVNFSKFTQSEGLPSPNIRKIIKDNFGFTWIATQDGLCKFDGIDFVPFNTSVIQDKQKTIGSDFHGLAIYQDRVYALTSNGGLNIINIITNSVIAKIGVSTESLMGDWYHSMCIMKNEVIVVTYRGKIFKFNIDTRELTLNGKLQYAGEKGGIVHEIIYHRGLLYMFSPSIEVSVYNEALKKIYDIQYPGNIKSFVPEIKINHVDIDPTGKFFLMATSAGLFEFNIHNKTILPWKGYLFPQLNELSGVEILAFSINDQFLFFSTGNGLYKTNLKTFSLTKIIPPVLLDSETWFSRIRAIYCDKDFAIAGNHMGLILLNFKSKLINFNRSSRDFNVKIGHGYHLCAAGDNNILACSPNGIYNVNINNGEIVISDTSQGYYQALEINQNKLFSGEKRAFILNRHGLNPAKLWYSSLDSLSDDFIIASIKISDSMFLLASSNGRGVYCFNPQENSIKIINSTSWPDSIIDLAINNFYINKKGEVMIICDKAVSVYDWQKGGIKSHVLKDPKSGTALGPIMDCAQIKDQFFFLVYGWGLVVTDLSFHITEIIAEAGGLTNNAVYKIFKTTDSTLFLSSNNGLFYYNTLRKKIKNLCLEAGVTQNSFDETSGCRIGNKLFFGGLGGVSMIDADKVSFNETKPAVFFTRILIEKPKKSFLDTANILLTKFYIPNDAIQTTIYLSGINYTNPKGIIFKYRIKEISEEWIDIGNKNSITLIGLNPGRYHLSIQVFNEDGIGSEIKTLILHFLPKWHQTLGFKLGLGLLAFSLIYAFYRYRISQIKKQQKIRKDIANDLHDDIGSTLNSVKVYTHLAVEGKNKEQYIQMAQQNLEQASIGLRDMIWVLDDKLDTADELMTRIKQFAIPLANALQVETDFKCDFDIQDKLFSKDEKRNLLLICKEAINNSIKYSGASLISVHFTQVKKNIRVMISDNGKGFDKEIVSSGNGLKNMQYRAKQINCTCELESSPGSGTIITISSK